MDSIESKVLIALVGLVLLVTGAMWVAFFPAGGVVTALLGVIVVVWSVDRFLFGRRGERGA